MEIVKTVILDRKEKQQVFDLWNSEYPINLGFTKVLDMDNYLNMLPNLMYYLLKDDKKQLKGWAMTFSSGTEIWFAITVSTNVQRRGFGTLLLHTLKNENDLLNGWVIDHENDYKRNGQIYQSPLPFYKKNEFTILSEYRLELPVLSAVKITWNKKNQPLT
ncbi:MAG: hypothetical protein JSS67_11190 [Bacteroidetes bacterium]|nr:hypothetical protein [Bacteroidota bacterium]